MVTRVNFMLYIFYHSNKKKIGRTRALATHSSSFPFTQITYKCWLCSPVALPGEEGGVRSQRTKCPTICKAHLLHL